MAHSKLKYLHPSEIDNSNDYSRNHVVSAVTKRNVSYLSSFDSPRGAFDSMTRQAVPTRR